MADLIKKIKIKKQDGTFTDYIPIGAEAQNIETNDGDSVQLKLNKKPYFFDTVADMKADTKLKIGDYVCTLGYYEPNDGGAGEYRIVSGNYIDDGGSYHRLKNALFAELIVRENVNVKQFGAKGDKVTNDYVSFVNSIAYCKATNKYTLYIPIGDYKISTNLIIDFPLSIRGEYCQYYDTNYTNTVSKGSRLLCDYNGSEPFIKYANSSNRMFGVKIEDLQIDGNYNNCIGLYLRRIGWEGYLSKLKIHNFNNTGLLLDRVYDTTFVNCEIIRCGDSNPSDNPNYALVLTDNDSNPDTTNACHFLGVHIEHCRYSTAIIKGRNNVFSSCKWEVAQGNLDLENPSILFDKSCMETTFEGCMFVPIGINWYETQSVSLSEIPPMIKSNSITNRLSYISFNGCQFSAPGEYGAYFIENNSGKMGITNCCFNTLSPKIYSLKLTRTLISNCHFNILNIYDEQNLSSCPIWLEVCQVENCYFNFSSTRGSFIKNKAMYLNSNNKIKNNRYFSVSPYDGSSANNVVDREPYILLDNTNYLNAMGLTENTVDWNNLTIDLQKLNYSNFLLNFSQNVKITNITNGQNGEMLNFINHASYTVTFVGSWNPSAGSSIQNAGTSWTTNTILEAYGNATLVKVQYYWKTTSVN